jgi:hypothetical protein
VNVPLLEKDSFKNWRRDSGETSAKPVSQICRFHLQLGYDACFLIISVGGLTVPLLQQFFAHAAGAQFKAPASFNFSLKFSECQRRTVKKHSKVVEPWLYGALIGTGQLFSSAGTIFFSATSDRLLVCTRKAP